MRTARVGIVVATLLSFLGTWHRSSPAEDRPEAPPAPQPPVRDDDEAVLAWFETLGLPSSKDQPWVEVLAAGTDPRVVVSTGVLLTDDPSGFVVLRDGLFRERYARTGEWPTELHDFRAADFARDTAALLEAVARPKHEAVPFPAFGGARSVADVVRLSARARLAAERGEPALAAELLRAARALPRRGGDAQELVRRVSASLEVPWIWNAVVAFGDRRTPLRDLVEPFRGFLSTWPASKHAATAKEAVAVLERMLEQEAARSSSPKAIESMTKDEQIAEWIFRLREQNGYQFGQPGSPSIWPDDRGEQSPAERLAAFGYDAMPALIDAIDDVEFTRTVGFWRDFTYSHYVVRVGDAALAVMERIAGRSFWSGKYTAASMVKDEQQKETQERVRAWWKEFQAKGERTTLIDAVRSGGPESAEQANRLLERFPADALEAIVAGIAAAKEDRTRFYLAQTLRFATGLDEKALAALFRTLMASDAFLETRVMAAEWLHAHGDPDALRAMIEVWQGEAPRSVNPFADDRWVERLAGFLVECGDAAAVRALAVGLDARDRAIRLTVADAVRGLLRGSSTPPDLAPAHRAAIEDLLASLLEDEASTGRSSNWGTGSIDDERICDAAAAAWFDLFSAQTGTDFLGRAMADRDRAIETLLAERSKAGRGPSAHTRWPRPLLTPIEDAVLAPTLPTFLEGDTPKGREARAAIARFGPGASLPLARAAAALAEDRRAPVLAFARELAVQVVGVEIDPKPAEDSEIEAARAAAIGAPLDVDRLVAILRAVLAPNPAGTVATEVKVVRRAADPGVIVRLRWRVVPAGAKGLSLSLFGRQGAEQGRNMRAAADVGADVATIDDGWTNLRHEVEEDGALAPDEPFSIDVRLAPAR